MPLVQHGLLALLTCYTKGKITLEKIVEKTCHNPAILFEIKERGYLRENYFADLVILDLNKSTKEDKTKNIEVKFNIYSEKSISKLNKDKIKMSNEIYIYIFRDYYVAMEYFLENFKDVEILSPENLKNEFDEKINKLRIMVSK